MPAHRKYFERYQTAVSLDRKEYDLTRVLQIPLSDALRIGINSMIQTLISQNDKRLTHEILEEFIEIQRRDLADLKEYIRMQDLAQQTLQNLSDMKKEGDKPKKEVRIWDPDEEKYVMKKVPG